MPSTTAIEKAQLRAWIRKRLKELPPEALRESDDALFRRFLSLPRLARAHTILLYHGMGTEPDTGRLIPLLLDMGHSVALPRCLPGNEMEVRLVQKDSCLVRHPLGMLEPGEECPLVERSAVDLVLAPGLAFDRSGGRLGQGGGYYDRWLAEFHGFTAALCREILLLDKLPREEHDLSVDLVITEGGLWGPAAGEK